MILIIIAIWTLVGFVSSLRAVEIFKKNYMYDDYPWNVLSDPEKVSLILGTILGFITLAGVIEYEYAAWRTRRELKKLSDSFNSKEFQDILNKIPEEDSQMLRDSIEQFQKEMSEYGKSKK